MAECASVCLTPGEQIAFRSLFYHTVSAEQADRMEALRAAYLGVAQLLIRSSKPSRSQSLALTHLEDSCMRAIQAVALEGTPLKPRHVTFECFE